MKSFPLGKIKGIQIELHSTFVWLLVLVFIFLAIFASDILLQSFLILIMLFFSVALHELVHSLVSVSRGFKVQKIMLLPIGGVSIMDELPTKPKDEFLISVSGPLFNFAVVLAVILAVKYFSLPFPPEILNGNISLETLDAALLNYPLFAFLWVNLILGAFNLFVPALPLDGGRVLRSIIATFLGFNKATHIVAAISFYLGILLLLIGFFSGNVVLAIIALFVVLGSRQENEIVVMKESLAGKNIELAIEKFGFLIRAESSLEDALVEMNLRNKTAFLVKLDKGFGYVDVGKISMFKKSQRFLKTAAEVAEKVPEISLNDPAAEVLSKMLSKGYPVLPVIDHDFLIGAVYLENLQKFYELSRIK